MTYKNVNLDSQTLHEAEMKVAEYENYLNSKFRREELKFPEEELHLVQFATTIRSEVHSAALNLFYEMDFKLREIEHKIINLSGDQIYEDPTRSRFMPLDALAQEIHELREFWGSSWIDSTPGTPDITPPSSDNEFMERKNKFMEKINKEQN